MICKQTNPHDYFFEYSDVRFRTIQLYCCIHPSKHTKTGAAESYGDYGHENLKVIRIGDSEGRKTSSQYLRIRKF